MPRRGTARGLTIEAADAAVAAEIDDLGGAVVGGAVGVGAVVAVVLAVHLERIRARAANVNQRAEKRCAMNSTICRHHNLVAQLFLTVMARRKFVCVVDHRSQISQKKLAQIQQHS